MSCNSLQSAHIDAFHPGQLWPDTDGVHINAHGGGMLLHDGVHYWFGEHKIEGKAGNAAHVGVHCYSSTNLYQWKNEGIALAVSDDPASPITRGCILERPKVLFNSRTRQFVMWFHLELKDNGYRTALAGVAVSDKVTGPYRFLHKLRPNAGHWPANVPDSLKRPITAEDAAFIQKLDLRGGPVPNYPTDLIFRRDFETGQMSRDMTLFQDADGTAYHIHSSEDNGTMHISRLTDDFLNTSGNYIRIFSGRFHEAPAIFTQRGKYFLFSSDCTGWRPNAARLSMADSIWGPWSELGNPCVGPADRIATTFDSQSTYVLPVAGKPDAFIFMADRWQPENAIDGRYIWLPIQFKDGRPFLEWFDAWGLDFFNAHP